MDLNGVFTDINESAEKLAQCPKEHFIGRSFFDISHADDKEMYKDLFERSKSGDIKNITVDTINISGRKITIDITYIPITLEGQILGVSSIARDVTEKLKLQKEKVLQYLISSHIDNEESLKKGIDNALREICKFAECVHGEIWFPVSKGKYIKLKNYFCDDDPGLIKFVNSSKTIKVEPGQGMQGTT